MKLKESEDDDDIEDDDDTDDSEDGDEAETDNVGDASVEINVEELIHELETGGELAARRRLEEIMEQKRAKRDLEDFEDYDI